MQKNSKATRGKVVGLDQARERRGAIASRVADVEILGGQLQDAVRRFITAAMSDRERLSLQPEIALVCRNLHLLAGMAPLLARYDLPEDHRAALVADLNRTAIKHAPGLSPIKYLFGAVAYAAQCLPLGVDPDPETIRYLVEDIVLPMLIGNLTISDVRALDHMSLGLAICAWNDTRRGKRAGKYEFVEAAIAKTSFAMRKASIKTALLDEKSGRAKPSGTRRAARDRK